FPTRRSSDLTSARQRNIWRRLSGSTLFLGARRGRSGATARVFSWLPVAAKILVGFSRNVLTQAGGTPWQATQINNKTPATNSTAMVFPLLASVRFEIGRAQV